jgi:hypothetical protein
MGRTSLENYTQPVMFALVPDKQDRTYNYLVPLLSSADSVGSPKVIKVDFEAAVIWCNKYGHSKFVITGCNFQFNQSLWKQIQNVGLNGGIRRK